MSIATEIKRIKTAKENIINTLKSKNIQIEENTKISDIDEIIKEVPIIDTSDATATENDILEGKTAYVNNNKIQGILKAGGEGNATLEIPNATSFTISSCIKKIKELDMSGIANISNLFGNCTNLIEIPEVLDTSNATNMYRLFYYCTALETVPLLDASKCENVSEIFRSCYALKNVGGLLNIGKAYTRTTANYSYYAVSCKDSTSMTYESLLNLLNGLYDLNLSYDVANGGTLYRQSCIIGSRNISKLQATEEGLAAIEEANRKGWDIT